MPVEFFVLSFLLCASFFCNLVFVEYIYWINSIYSYVLINPAVHHRWMTCYGRFLLLPSTTILRYNPKQNIVRFMLDGENIDQESTPAALALEDNDQIDCFLAQVGGGGGRVS